MQKEQGPDWTWSMAVTLSLGTCRQEANGFKARLVYVVNSRVAKAT